MARPFANSMVGRFWKWLLRPQPRQPAGYVTGNGGRALGNALRRLSHMAIGGDRSLMGLNSSTSQGAMPRDPDRNRDWLTQNFSGEV